jgi:MFS family permease
MFFTALPIVYPLAVREFGVSYATLGLVLSLAGIVGGLLQGAAGLYERVSARTILALQNGLSAVVAVLAAAAPSFALFGAARWAASVITSPQHPVGASVLASRFSARRAVVLSWHTIGGSIGTLSVPLLASTLIVAFGWRWTLAFFSIPLLAGAALLWHYLPHEGAVLGISPTRAHFWRTVLSRPAILLICASTVAAAGRGLGSLSSYIPAYLRDGLQLPQITVGLIYTVLLIGSVVGPLGVGYLSDRLGRTRIIVLAYLAGAAALVGFVWSSFSILPLVIMAVLVGVFVYSESPLLQSLYSEAIEGTSSRSAFGIYFMVAYGAGSLWLVVLGAIIDHFGFQAAFLVMAGSFLPAAALVVAARLLKNGPHERFGRTNEG